MLDSNKDVHAGAMMLADRPKEGVQLAAPARKLCCMLDANCSISKADVRQVHLHGKGREQHSTKSQELHAHTPARAGTYRATHNHKECDECVCVCVNKAASCCLSARLWLAWRQPQELRHLRRSREMHRTAITIFTQGQIVP